MSSDETADTLVNLTLNRYSGKSYPNGIPPGGMDMLLADNPTWSREHIILCYTGDYSDPEIYWCPEGFIVYEPYEFSEFRVNPDYLLYNMSDKSITTCVATHDSGSWTPVSVNDECSYNIEKWYPHLRTYSRAEVCADAQGPKYLYYDLNDGSVTPFNND